MNRLITAACAAIAGNDLEKFISILDTPNFDYIGEDFKLLNCAFLYKKQYKNSSFIDELLKRDVTLRYIAKNFYFIETYTGNYECLIDALVKTFDVIPIRWTPIYAANAACSTLSGVRYFSVECKRNRL